ncbi:MAG TPA: GNAT family N-acetyltransferase [Chitinophagaceae bacterium]|nr:GNAT family N-acetyltransferase [Chitinophagaceae bacterium]
MNITWHCKAFEALTPHELYSILQLRNEVFIVEQNCVYQDCDDKDQHSHHFMGWQQTKLVAYTRLIPAGVVYEEVSIGRVVTSPSVRGTKTGKELMQRSIDKIHELYGKNSIKIGAQLYLKRFYESLGFIKCSDTYLEDGIEHIKMIRN